MNRHSIRFRLTAGYAGILAVTFAIVGVGVWWAIRDSVNETVDKDLRTRLATMRELLRRQATVRDSSIEELIENASVAPAGSRFRIGKGTGGWLYQSPGTELWGAAPDPSRLSGRGSIQTVSQKGKPVRVLSATVPGGIIQIGVPMDEFMEMLDAFTWIAVVGSPLLLVLASAGGYWMSRRALAPVEQIARTADDIEARNLSKRLPLSGAGDELDRLSTTLNAMIARLEDSFRHITQFTADASHELRTPVAIVRTTAEVTRRKPRSAPEYEAALDRILSESERTSELIEDLMFLARADADVERLASEPVRMVELIRGVCFDASVLANARGIQLKIGEMQDRWVSGDCRALRRLLLILLDNAIKYSKPDGAVEVSLDVCQREGAPAVAVAVRDHGIGIGPDDLPHIFERFYRASKDRSRRGGGAGLGLSIAQSIAHQHGGEVVVESELGLGTTVRLLLPAR